MPLAKPLPELRRELQEILSEDLAAALNALRELLPEQSDKHGQVLALRARLNDANKERFRNTIDSDEYLRRVDTIRAGCFDLIRDLEEADFEVVAEGSAASARTSGDGAAKHGNVLYRVPHRMPLSKPSICTVRVAIDEDAILEDIVLDENVQLRKRVEVSDMMRAELLDPEGGVFSIRPLSETEQLVRDEGYTQWLFSVTPHVEGKHQLLVKVSMMEYNANLDKYVPREVSVLETVTVVAEAAAQADSEDAPLKATGDRFTLGPEASLSVEPQRPAAAIPQPAPSIPPVFQPVFTPSAIPGDQAPRSRPAGSRALRPAAFFLIFLVAGGGAVWAFTPPPTRDWWVASLKDDAGAYAAYIEKYEGTEAKTHLEKAYYRKADKTGLLADLRTYQRTYPQGQFRARVLEKVTTLEAKAIAGIRQQPDAENISRFAQDFPESERLPEIRQAVGNRAELIPAVENAYVQSIQIQPSAQKVTAYLRDFPQRERLQEVATAVETRPEVMREVQPALEDAFLKDLEQNPTPAQAEKFLQRFPEPTQRERFERILEQKPALKKQLQDKKSRSETSQTNQKTEPILSDTETRRKEQESENERRAKNRPATDIRQRNRKSGLTMVTVQGGTFTMGCQDGRDKNCLDSEKPAHAVTLASFEIGKYEVTQADWREVMGSDPPDLDNENCDECPVEGVSWNEVQDFIKNLNAKTGKKYRQPTEAEWEYAARGGAQSKGYNYSGGNELDNVAWYGGNYRKVNTSGIRKTTHPVGKKAPNELGLFDMSGNVHEWCSDWYGNYAADTETNPAGLQKPSSYRVYRGGSWLNQPERCRTACRRAAAPAARFNYLGFRLAHSIQ